MTQPEAPGLPWRLTSTLCVGIAGLLSRAFLHLGNKCEIEGLEGFLELLDERADVDERQRGLITGMRSVPMLFPTDILVSNHLSMYVCNARP